jgi:hypothetical protein
MEEIMNKLKKLTLLSMASMLAFSSANAQETEEPQKTQEFKGERYSTPSEHPENVYFGDAHIHTKLSMDAALWGTSLGPEDVYRYARGEELTSAKGWKTKLRRPLNWTVVADHSDAYGFYDFIAKGADFIVAEPQGAAYYQLLKEGKNKELADQAIKDFGAGKIPWDINKTEYIEPGWKETVGAAEAANDPGKFTAFIAYEWTANPDGDNNHRVVIYRDAADKTLQTLPLPTMNMGEKGPNPETLWASLQAYEDKTGGQVMAIPHNANWSSGQMFQETKFQSKKPLDKSYVENRSRWEPLYETTQVKGDSETHPFLSPDDEFADYETWDVSNLSFNRRVTTDMLAGSYARSALKVGLKYQEKFGVNPFQFGLIGGGDTHNGFPGLEEDNFMGKSAVSEPSPERWEEPFRRVDFGTQPGWSEAASGLTAVWATDNTREALWDAMKRKEVYATTGTRAKVRVFGGWDFVPGDEQRSDYVALGYDKGVPMGGELHGDPQAAAVRKAFKEGKTAKTQELYFLGYGNSVAGDPNEKGKVYTGIAAEIAKQRKSPTFLVAALMDPMGGTLDRVQMVKGWRDSEGELHEKVYDIAWSDNRIKDPDTGKLPPVGNTVNIAEATWNNSIGDAQLSTVWQDPDFDNKEQAFYYVRVLEIPTPRWTAYDAKRFNVKMGPEVPMTLQERVYTSPIWYIP